MTPPDDVLQREAIVAMLPRLRRFARTLCRNHADADDLVQIGVERALRHLATWRPDARFDSWMFKITRNAWIDEFRARRRRQRVFASEEEGEQVGDSATDPTGLMAIQAALEQLPDEQRLAVGLVLIEGLPYKEAAEVMDVPIGTLTSRLARGREALQALLADSAGAPT